MSTQLQIRHDTLDNWNTADCILKVGELGIDTTNWRVRIGDGVHPWTELLPFLNALNANHHDLDESTDNSDNDEIVIWDDSIDAYRKQTRRTFLKNDSVTLINSVSTLEATPDVTANRLFYVTDSNTFYRFYTNMGLVEADHIFVLNSATADARFVAVSGSIINGTLNISGNYQVEGLNVVGPRLSGISTVSTTVSENATSTYTTNERDMINNLKDDVEVLRNALNLVLNRIKTHGLIES